MSARVSWNKAWHPKNSLSAEQKHELAMWVAVKDKATKNDNSEISRHNAVMARYCIRLYDNAGWSIFSIATPNSLSLLSQYV